MTYKAKIHFLWFAPEDKVSESDPHFQDWKSKGYVYEVGKEIEMLDLNGDGKVDAKDSSVAGHVLKKVGRPKKV